MHISKKSWLGAAAVGAVCAVATSLPSYAGTNGGTSIVVDDFSYQHGHAKFYHDGDYINVCDDDADGWSVWAKYKINSGTYHDTSQFNGGSGTCGHKSTGNPAEGSKVTYYAAVQVDNGFDLYGTVKSGTA